MTALAYDLLGLGAKGEWDTVKESVLGGVTLLCKVLFLVLTLGEPPNYAQSGFLYQTYARYSFL